MKLKKIALEEMENSLNGYIENLGIMMDNIETEYGEILTKKDIKQIEKMWKMVIDKANTTVFTTLKTVR